MARIYGLYNRLLKMPILYLYCITIIVIAASTGLWWYFLYSPAYDATNKLQFTINDMRSQFDELRKTEKILSGISQSIDAQNMNKSAMKIRNFDAQQSLSLIADSAINAGISMQSCKLSAQREESWCCIHDINGDFKGSLDQIISFFDTLKKSKQIIDATQCNLVASGVNTFYLHAIFKVYC
jgi:hypothetical protein